MFTRSDIRSALGAAGGDPTAAAKMLRQHAVNRHVSFAVRGDVAKIEEFETFASGRAARSIHFSAFSNVTFNARGEPKGMTVKKKCPERWRIGREMGGGSIGVVYDVTPDDTSDDRAYVMKKVFSDRNVDTYESMVGPFCAEVYFNVKMSEIGVAPDVFDWGVCMEDGLDPPLFMYIVSENAGESLEDIFDVHDEQERPNKAVLDADMVRRITEKIIAMAKGGCWHDDLTERNVLVSGDGTVHIIDYGTAREVDDTEWQRYAASDWYDLFSGMDYDKAWPVPNRQAAVAILSEIDDGMAKILQARHLELRPWPR